MNTNTLFYSLIGLPSTKYNQLTSVTIWEIIRSEIRSFCLHAEIIISEHFVNQEWFFFVWSIQFRLIASTSDFDNNDNKKKKAEWDILDYNSKIS